MGEHSSSGSGESKSNFFGAASPLLKLTTGRDQKRCVLPLRPRSEHVQETANVKVSSVVSDVLGKSGRRLLAALIEGVSDARAAGRSTSLNAAFAGQTLRSSLLLLSLHHNGQVHIRVDGTVEMEGASSGEGADHY
jgi:hypothetical protein